MLREVIIYVMSEWRTDMTLDTYDTAGTDAHSFDSKVSVLVNGHI